MSGLKITFFMREHRHLLDIKKKIVQLLEQQPYTKAQMKEILFVESDRFMTRVLKELRKDNVIELNGHYYSLYEPQVVSGTHQLNWQFITLRFLFSFMSIGASIMSIRNTSVWLLSMFPAFYAYLLSTIMSMFMVASAGVVVFLWQKRHIFTAIPILLLWGVITFTSMSSTVIGMYNAMLPNVTAKLEKETIDNKSNLVYNTYQSEIEDLESIIADKKQSLQRYNTLIASYDSIEKRDADRASYNALAWAISDAESYIKKYTDEIRVLRGKMLVTVENKEVVEIPATFYEVMANIFHKDASFIQFILHCFVACLVDIIAPLGAGIALFLKEE